MRRNVGFVGDSIQINYGRCYICGWRKNLYMTYFGVVFDGSDEFVIRGILEIQECRFEALVLGCDALDVAKGSAIDVIDADNVSVWPEGLQDGGSGG